MSSDDGRDEPGSDEAFAARSRPARPTPLSERDDVADVARREVLAKRPEPRVKEHRDGRAGEPRAVVAPATDSASRRNGRASIVTDRVQRFDQGAPSSDATVELPRPADLPPPVEAPPPPDSTTSNLPATVAPAPKRARSKSPKRVRPEPNGDQSIPDIVEATPPPAQYATTVVPVDPLLASPPAPVVHHGPPTAPPPGPTPLDDETTAAHYPTAATVAAGPQAAAQPRRPVRLMQGGRRRRPRVRRVTRVIRHVDPWSVFKVALCFSFVLYGVCLTAGVLLWNVAYTTGTIDNIERFFESFGWDTFEFKGGELYHNAWIAGLFAAIGLTGLIVLGATLFNLITDLVGGIRVTVLEEEVVERNPAAPSSLLRGRAAQFRRINEQLDGHVEGPPAPPAP